MLENKPEYNYNIRGGQKIFLVSEESKELEQQELILNVNEIKRIGLDGLINVEECGSVSKSI